MPETPITTEASNDEELTYESITEAERAHVDSIVAAKKKEDEAAARRVKLDELAVRQATPRKTTQPSQARTEEVTSHEVDLVPRKYGSPVKLFSIGAGERGDRKTAERILSSMGLRAIDGLAVQNAGQSSIVPTELHADIVGYAAKLTPLASTEYARVELIKGTEGKVPRLVSGVTFSKTKVAEGGTFSRPAAPVWDMITLTLRKWGGVIPMSKEILSDSALAVLPKLVELFGEAYANQLEDFAFNGLGAGSEEPEGVFTNGDVPTVEVRDNTDPVKLAEDLEKMYFTLPAKFRADSIWMFSNAAMAKINSLRGSNDQKLLGTWARNDTVLPTIMNRPVFETGAIAENGGDDENEAKVVLANWKQMAVIGRGYTLETEVNTQSDEAFNKGLILIRAEHRMDQKIAVPVAGVVLTGLKVSEPAP